MPAAARVTLGVVGMAMLGGGFVLRLWVGLPGLLGAAIIGCGLLVLGYLPAVQANASRSAITEFGSLALAVLVADLTSVPIPVFGLVVLLLFARKRLRRLVQAAQRRWLILAISIAFCLASVSGIALWSTGRAFWLATDIAIIGNVCDSVMWAILLVASAVNSIFEELLWRVRVAEQIEPHMPSGIGVALIATTFGLAHWLALPNGISGVLLTFVFSIASSLVIRALHGCIIPSVVAHIGADLFLLSKVYGLW